MNVNVDAISQLMADNCNNEVLPPGKRRTDLEVYTIAGELVGQLYYIMYACCIIMILLSNC